MAQIAVPLSAPWWHYYLCIHTELKHSCGGRLLETSAATFVQAGALDESLLAMTKSILEADPEARESLKRWVFRGGWQLSQAPPLCARSSSSFCASANAQV